VDSVAFGTHFGQVIRHARKAAGLTLAELAEQSGLGVRTIGDIERGRTIRPRAATVSLLCGQLGLPVPAPGPRLPPGPPAPSPGRPGPRPRWS
jgi:transcriptional regulator with XRE-family HTH domain